MIHIYKGYPISFVVTLKDDGTPVDLNDGTWNVTIELRYQVEDGPIPFTITGSPSNQSILVSFDRDQTNTLDHLSTGYVLIVNASKVDDTVFLKTNIPVVVSNGL